MTKTLNKMRIKGFPLFRCLSEVNQMALIACLWYINNDPCHFTPRTLSSKYPSNFDISFSCVFIMIIMSAGTEFIRYIIGVFSSSDVVKALRSKSTYELNFHRFILGYISRI